VLATIQSFCTKVVALDQQGRLPARSPCSLSLEPTRRQVARQGLMEPQATPSGLG
jgi:hypothetical protein